MESSLTTPLQDIYTNVGSHHYINSFQTSLSQFLSSDPHLQLLVLQIIQLIQDYENLMQSTPDFNTNEEESKNNFTKKSDTTQLLQPNSLQKEIYHSTQKKTEDESPRLQSMSLNSLKNRYLIPHKTLIHDQTILSRENLERIKHDLQQRKILQSDNMIYYKLEALMENQKILVNQMRLNMVNLQAHEEKLEKYFESKMRREIQLIKEVKNQNETIKILKYQIQTCKDKSSSKLLELKNRTGEINNLKARLKDLMLQNLSDNSIKVSNGCLLELKNKEDEIHTLKAKLKNKDVTLENITSYLISNSPEFSNNSGVLQTLKNLLKRKNTLETQLTNCSASRSALLLQLKNKSTEVYELMSQLKHRDICDAKLKNCSTYLSHLSSEVNKTAKNLDEHKSKLKDMETKLQMCADHLSTTPLPIYTNTSEIQFLVSLMRERDTFKVLLQNCSYEKVQQLSQLRNKSNEVQTLTSKLRDTDNLEAKLKNCTNDLLFQFSELKNKTRTLDEQISKLQDKETQLQNCSCNSSSILPTLKNKTNEITFLISILRDRDILKVQLQNCSTEKMELMLEIRNRLNEIKDLTTKLRNQDILGINIQNCSNSSSVLNFELQTCSRNLSSALMNLNNKTNEVQRLTSTLKIKDSLEAQVQNCYHILYTTRNYNIRIINNLTTTLKKAQICDVQLQNCTRISSTLQLELENRTREIQNLNLENKDNNYEKHLQSCFNFSQSMYLELKNKTKQVQNLTSDVINMDKLRLQLKICLDNSSILMKKLNNKSSTIHDLTLKLQRDNELVDKINNCTEHSTNLSLELRNKTSYIQELTTKLITESNNKQNCSTIPSALLSELRYKTIQVQNLTSELENNTLIKNLQQEMKKAEQKLVSTST
jgi:hypothetical protein